MPRSPESRARQAQRIAEWKPWLKSTGPRTEAGKSRSARNAHKGGWRPALREIARSLQQLETAGANQAKSNQIRPNQGKNNFRHDSTL